MHETARCRLSGTHGRRYHILTEYVTASEFPSTAGVLPLDREMSGKKTLSNSKVFNTNMIPAEPRGALGRAEPTRELHMQSYSTLDGECRD